MKIHPLLIAAFSLATLAPARAADAPRKLLVVSVTAGFRHSSIPVAEKAIADLAAQSGAFTVDFIHQPEGQAHNPRKPTPPPAGADADEQAKYQKALDQYNADQKNAQAGAAEWSKKLEDALQPLAPANLAHYDGLCFLSTTGDLPIPDKEGLLAWIKAGHAFIGFHSASDTFHHWPGYLDMIGGEFLKHGKQVPADVVTLDPAHPADAGVPNPWHVVQEEIYNFKDFDPARVHGLLELTKSPLDGSPGHYPVAWERDYGQGRVFYCSFGHREDLWDPSFPSRINPPQVSNEFRRIVLNGIEWALGVPAK